MMHRWTNDTDGNGAATRVVIFDFRKAFDLIDHSIWARKLRSFDLQNLIIHCIWITNFLQDWKQRVKLEQHCHSEWRTIPARVPQETKLGPWLFLMMINDISVPGVQLWKYVDDITISKSVVKNQPSKIQAAVYELRDKTKAYKFQLNEIKCKELRIDFSKSDKVFNPINVNDTNLELVNHTKLLGLNLSRDLKWNIHISEIVKKAASRLYFLRQLKRSKVASKELTQFHITCM